MNKTRLLPTDILYAILWIAVALLCLLDLTRERASLEISPLIDSAIFLRIAKSLLPFFILFAVNNWLLIPKLLLPGRLRSYGLSIIILALLILTYQYFDFQSHIPPLHAKPRLENGQPLPRRLFPLPLLLDFIYDLLTIGANVAIALAFQRFDDRLDRERLMKANAQNELSYLKAQINPHFYMNMLNNIHAMIEIAPEKAQEMVLDMSKLMRYMLYESSLPSTTLDKEIGFIRTYLDTMKKRFPDSRLSIEALFPDVDTARRVFLPPLLFLVFIENAFKHGVSYRSRSFIRIEMAIRPGRLDFSITNSLPPESHGSPRQPGIGLKNIRQRLELLYGREASLDINPGPDLFAISLSIPIDPADTETKPKPE